MTETTTQTPHPSEPQAKFLSDLLDKRTGFSPEFATRVREAIAGTRPMTRKQASTTIKWLLTHDKKAAPTATATVTAAPAAKPPWADEGLYRADDGQVWKVYRTQNHRLAAKTLTITPTGDGWAGRFEYVRGALYRVSEAIAAGTTHAMTEAEAIEFGKQYSMCCNCAADLSEDRSIAAGFGPTCAGHRGWHYPSKAEAAEILGRPIL